MTARITTVIPTYRRPALLARAIQSVLNQTVGDFQVLVHDDASGDETAGIVEQFQTLDSRVRYYCHPRNIGAVANFNSALAQVDTPFFSIMSNDDFLLPTFYSTALQGFSLFPEAYFSATEVLYIDQANRFHGYSNLKFPPGPYSPPAGLFSMLGGNHPPTWTGVLFRKAVIQDVGLLDERVGPSIDYDYLYRIAARRGFIVSADAGAVFLIHPQSTGALCELRSIWPGEKYMIENIATADGLQPDIRAKARRLLSAAVKKRIFHMGRQAIKQRRPEEAVAAAHVLRTEFAAYATAFLLAVTAAACRLSSSTYSVLNCLNRLRHVGKPEEPAIPAAVVAAIRQMADLDRKVAPMLGLAEPS